jgi:Cof subfamily protein (haloacid dehalogenase superfamily)
LLDPSGELRDAVRDSVRRASEQGATVVLCTGRRYRTARPILEALAVDGPGVFQNGVVVKDSTGTTLHRHCLPRDVYSESLDLLRQVGSPVVYVDHPHGDLDFLCEPAERSHPFQGEYVRDNAFASRVVDSLDDPPSVAPVMMSCMAEEASLRELRGEVERVLGPRVRTNLIMNKVYRGHILEIVSPESGKWPALRWLAAQNGIAAHEIFALGDDHNDVELLANAGLGVAMDNAPLAVKRAADHVTASNADDGAVRALERFVLTD